MWHGELSLLVRLKLSASLSQRTVLYSIYDGILGWHHGWSGQRTFARGNNRWLWMKGRPTKDLYFFLVLKEQEKVKQRLCPSQRHVVFKSSGGCVGRQGAGTDDNYMFIALQHGQWCSLPSSPYQPSGPCYPSMLKDHPMVSTLVTLAIKNPQIPPFSLRYKERGKLLLQSVLCVIKPEQLVPQMWWEEQRNLQDKIVTPKLLVCGCTIIYPQNFQHVLQEITITVQLKGRENMWSAAQKHSTPGKTKRSKTLGWNTVLFIFGFFQFWEG